MLHYVRQWIETQLIFPQVYIYDTFKYTRDLTFLAILKYETFRENRILRQYSK